LAKIDYPSVMEAGESEYSALLKTRNLLIFRDAQNAGIGKIATSWNESGTRDFFTSVANEIGLSDTKARPKRSNLEVGFNLEGSWAARDWF